MTGDDELISIIGVAGDTHHHRETRAGSRDAAAQPFYRSFSAAATIAEAESA